MAVLADKGVGAMPIPTSAKQQQNKIVLFIYSFSMVCIRQRQACSFMPFLITLECR
jgi:hypothetical protein